MIGIGNAISIGLRRVGGFVGLLDRFPNAAAAYSLRKLRSGYTGSAVRVRRDVDGTELDFGFDSNGNLDTSSILDFVNVTETLPADYGSGAVAAYSLRKLRAAYSGSAVRVRRSSDNTEQDIGFTTQGELDTASLLSFVNEDVVKVETDFSTDTSGTAESGLDRLANQSIGGRSGVLKGTIQATTEEHRLIVNGVDTAANTHRIQTSIYIPSGQSGQTVDGFRIENGGFEVYATTTTKDTWVDIDVTWTSVPNANVFIKFLPSGGAESWTGNGTDEVYIGDVTITQTTADGLVSTWYDQSLSNDATQSTAADQPKIVDAGVLVTENGKPAIEFDGVDDRLITSSFASTLAQPSTTFIVNNAPNNTSNNTLIDGIIGSNRHLLIANANNYTLNAGAFVNTGANSDAQSLLYTLWNGASSEFASDGGTPNIINIGTHGLTGLTIGTNFGSSNANDGNVQEIILYNSDQSSNRPSIEANINSYYSIYTPTTNGFVKTWYDQSGNSNDATQSTASAQPKIVSAGSLVTEGTSAKPAIDFDGTDDYFTLGGTNDAGMLGDISVFSVNKNSISGNSVVVSTGLMASSFAPNMQWGINGGVGQYTGTTSDGTTRINESILTSDYGSQVLVSMINDEDGNLQMFADGVGSTGKTAVAPMNDANFALDVGRDSGGSRYYFDGTQQELILFASDQSSNRTGIETNINTFYAVYPDFSVSGLLHDYPNAAAAYSVRQLTIYNNGYKEKLIRIRRSSGGETDVFADDSYELSLNSRVSAGGTLGNWMGSDDGFVVTWYDQSTNGNDATQSAGASQPKIVSSGAVITEGTSAKPAIDFDGVDDWIDTGITNSQFSQVFVVKNTTGAGTAIAYSGAVSLQSLVYNTLDDDITFSGGSGLYTIDNLNVKGYLNGVDETGAAATFTQTFNRLYFGSVNGTSSFISGKIQEYIHFAYASDQSANRTGIETNINTFYSIYP